MTDTEPPIIELFNLRKRYQRREVLRIDRLSLRRRERVLLYGANASGKSTLINLIAGIARPSSGDCRIAHDFRNARRLLLPQRGGLYADLTVRQNLLILAQLHDCTPNCAPFTALLNGEVERHLDARLETLSGGMQRVLSLAALLSVLPELLFLDEPFEGLDVDNGARVRVLLDNYVEQISLLVVTAHSAAAAGDNWRKIGLAHGQIAEMQ